MGKHGKFQDRILKGLADKNINFKELCRYLKALGFKERIRGDHHILTLEGVEEILNLQPKKTKAKAYQVKQVRFLLLKYSLGDKDA